jgi:hypothetical protein
MLDGGLEDCGEPGFELRRTACESLPKDRLDELLRVLRREVGFCQFYPQTQGSLPRPTVPHWASALVCSLPLNCLLHV